MAGEPAAPRVPALDHEPGAIVDVACDGGIACIAFDDGSAIRVTPVANGIVRIAASPDGRWPARRPWAITSLSEPDRRRPARVLARGDGGVELEAAGLGVRVGDRGLVRVTRLDGPHCSTTVPRAAPAGIPSRAPHAGAAPCRPDVATSASANAPVPSIDAAGG